MKQVISMKQQMKKLLIGCLILCLTVTGLAFMPQAVQAASSDSGVDGEVQWDITGDTLTISAVEGTQGRMNDYENNLSPWSKSPSVKNVKNVIVKNGVTQLSAGAFGFGTKKLDLELNSMTISGTVDAIPMFFCSMYSIDRLVVNEGTKSIELEAFAWTTVHNFICAKSVQMTMESDPFCGEADGCITGLENVYGYSGSAAEKYVLDYKEYAASHRVYSFDDKERNADSWKFISIDGYTGDLDDLNPSDYDTTDTTPEQDSKAALLKKVKVTKNLSIKKGKAKAIKVTLPEGLTKVTKYTGKDGEVKISYKVNNKKIAKVNGKGKVTGKKKGKAKVTTTVRLQDGTKKTFTTKVAIKK